MGRDPGRSGKTRGPSHGLGGRRHRSSSNAQHIMGRGPGRPINCSDDGPRPGPVHQVSWMRCRGPARLIN